MRLGLSVILMVCCPALAVAQADPSPTEEQPSEALLEFLGELEPVDEETWQLLEENALRDVAEQKEVKSE